MKVVYTVPEHDGDPQFCEGCPLVPKGVIAELTGAEVVTSGELSRYRFAHESPEAAAHFAGKIRIHSRVVSSKKPGVDVGDEAHMLVDGATGTAELRALITGCQGSARKILQGRVCGALGAQR